MRKLENINEELLPYLQQLGLPDIRRAAIPHINRTATTRDYSTYYTEETRLLVAELYAYDINEFGYEYG